MAARVSNNFEDLNYLKWPVELPRLKHPIVSNRFSFQRIERHFNFCVHPLKRDWFYLYFHSRDEDFEPFEVIVYMEGPNEPIYYCRILVVNPTQEISSYHQDDVKLMMEELGWSNVPFVFLFPGKTDLQLYQGRHDICSSPSDRNPSELSRLSTDTAKLLDDPNHDVVLECAGGLMNAHSVILSIRSEKFAELLRGWSSPGGRQIPNRFRVDDLDMESLRGIVYYLYTGRFNTQLNTDSAKHLFKAARSYSISMANRCADFLVENLTHDNCLDILHVAHSENDYDLKKRVILYVLDKKIPLQERWLGFRKENWPLAMDVYHSFYESRCNT